MGRQYPNIPRMRWPTPTADDEAVRLLPHPAPTYPQPLLAAFPRLDMPSPTRGSLVASSGPLPATFIVKRSVAR